MTEIDIDEFPGLGNQIDTMIEEINLSPIPKDDILLNQSNEKSNTNSVLVENCSQNDSCEDLWEDFSPATLDCIVDDSMLGQIFSDNEEIEVCYFPRAILV